MNPNYLEYDPSVIRTYIAKYQTIVPENFEYIKIVNNNIYTAFPRNNIKTIIYKRCEKFVKRYNAVVDLIEEGKKKDILGSYKKIAIPKRFGRKRIVYEPQQEFKFILQKFTDILEYVLGDTFSPRNRYKRVFKGTGRDAPCDMKNVKGKTITYVPNKNIIQSNISVDNVLYSIGHKMEKLLSYSTLERDSMKDAKYFPVHIYKFDIKDAFASTRLSLVKTIIKNKFTDCKVINFILDNIDMCFIDGVLPPGYPSSSIIYGFVKDAMLSRFRNKTMELHTCKIFSYVDDFYYMTRASKDLGQKVVKNFQKYIRRFGYRINKDKSSYIKIDQKDVNYIGYYIPQKILGKVACIKRISGYPHFQVTWKGSRQAQNKIRMLDYLVQKEKDSKRSHVDGKDSETILAQRKKGLEEFYFPRVASYTYRAQ